VLKKICPTQTDAQSFKLAAPGSYLQKIKGRQKSACAYLTTFQLLCSAADLLLDRALVICFFCKHKNSFELRSQTISATAISHNLCLLGVLGCIQCSCLEKNVVHEHRYRGSGKIAATMQNSWLHTIFSCQYQFERKELDLLGVTQFLSRFFSLLPRPVVRSRVYVVVSSPGA
jgi:hypothetical protein